MSTSPEPLRQPAHPVQLLRGGKLAALVQRGPTPAGDHGELMNVDVLGSNYLAAVTLVSVEQPRQSVCRLEWTLSASSNDGEFVRRIAVAGTSRKMWFAPGPVANVPAPTTTTPDTGLERRFLSRYLAGM